MAKMLHIVPDKCTGCMQCELACSWIQTGTFRPSQSVIRVSVFDEQASYAPHMCIQCNEAWCMSVCPVNAISIDRNQAKVVISELCIGCHLCTLACPFGVVFTLPETGKAAKCNLCGGQPACAVVCPTDAIEFVQPEPGQPPGAWLTDWARRVHDGYAMAMGSASEGES